MARTANKMTPSRSLPQACFYVGKVFHQRFFPREHKLNYKQFQLFINIDTVFADTKVLTLFSHNRLNLLSFYDRDYGPVKSEATQESLGKRVRTFLSAYGVCDAGDQIFLLSMPRILGFVFNPISVYFIYAPDGTLKALSYEVNNTFGDRHTYVHLCGSDLDPYEHLSKKNLHVSPFMEMDGSYRFFVTAPNDLCRLRIDLTTPKGRIMTASFAGHAKALSDQNVWQLFWLMPLLTLKVVSAIHFEAIKLILKGLWLKPKPPTEKSSSSIS